MVNLTDNVTVTDATALDEFLTTSGYSSLEDAAEDLGFYAVLTTNGAAFAGDSAVLTGDEVLALAIEELL